MIFKKVSFCLGSFQWYECMIRWAKSHEQRLHERVKELVIISGFGRVRANAIEITEKFLAKSKRRYPGKLTDLRGDSEHCREIARKCIQLIRILLFFSFRSFDFPVSPMSQASPTTRKSQGYLSNPISQPICFHKP